MYKQPISGKIEEKLTMSERVGSYESQGLFILSNQK